MRLSESKAKLAWAMPSVRKLNKVKRVQDDHLLCSVVLCYIEEQKIQKQKTCPSVTADMLFAVFEDKGL